MNLFDNLQSAVFNTVSNAMGYSAQWTPTNGDAPQTAQVLYKGPTEKEKLAGVEFDPEGLKMEYQFGSFIGLKAAVDLKPNKEKVFIYGVAGTTLECYISSVNELWDGKTFEASLQLKK